MFVDPKIFCEKCETEMILLGRFKQERKVHIAWKGTTTRELVYKGLMFHCKACGTFHDHILFKADPAIGI